MQQTGAVYKFRHISLAAQRYKETGRAAQTL